MTEARDDAASLTGVWNGLYSYDTAHPESAFTAVLFDGGGFLSGTIHETMHRRFLPSVETSAAIEGGIAGARVTFVKTYDGSGGQQHAVSYDGTLSADGSEIEGIWAIQKLPAAARGRFLMIRARRETQTEEVSREVAA